MKSILVVFNDSDAAEASLRSAVAIARRFDSYVEGMFVRRPPPIIAGEGITLPGDYVARFTEEAQRLATQARDRFERVVQAASLQRVEGIEAAGETACAGWWDAEGLEGQIVGERGRLFDLVVMSRGESPPGDWSATCESALFETGRPVLVGSAQAPERLGERVVLAWNGSTETARTLGLGLGLLAPDAELLVLSVEGGTVPGPSADDLARHLGRRGLKASARFVEPAGATDGEAILAQAEAFEADLLLKGAFTHGRLRQLIFGGATRHILTHATIPVLLAH